ncbi:signal peptidase I [Vagococcus lutrae]|uniref:Signal peptidase I n=1 Tax=Vagococcus lutrae TaxID=81947 RepID=A0AAE9XDT5_9ENTE|nr:signal peptidase I [Vagococcus lutrae]MDO5741878.1 signal peptidase I [Vagococcus sp.]MCO7151594.1 signal peptidase I [Vagococcus lutrae]MDT2805502.1 signal peptidase I [Vagococcus lutrae]MDT2812932.1 signal peptidase I [Vagococcus lutrae]MDT2819748.1 signal peptidase I [Vagococcus lutrae]
MSAKEWVKEIIWFLGLLAIMLIVKKYIMFPVAVSGHSMDPTLQDRERIMAVKLSKIERFDIVTFPAPDKPGDNYVKRIIGMPGDTVAYDNDKLLINGKEVAEPYLDEYKQSLAEGEVFTTLDTYLLDKPITPTKDDRWVTSFELTDLNGINEAVIPEGKVLVLGDNRPVSKDGRYIGLIDMKDISGELKFSFWPLSKFGMIK